MADSIRGTVLDNLGRPMLNVLVRVYLAGTSTLASIFSDKTLSTPITNDGATSPLTEADGSWGPFYLASGRYDIKYLKTGYTFDTTDLLDVHVWDEEQSGAAARIISTAYQGLAAVNVQAALEEHEKEKLTFADDFQDHVVTGLLGVDPGASLTMTIPGGTAYVMGIRVVKPSADADLTRTYTASKDTYVDISNTGVITYSEVANGAGAPAVTANSIRLEKVVTNGTEITSVVDLRTLQPGVKDATGTIRPTSNTALANAIAQYSASGVLGGPVTGSLIGLQILTSGTSYTPTAGTASIIIEMVGGGGGGGGVNVSIEAVGGGGASGGYLRKRFTGVTAGPYTYAIGAAGSAGSSTGGNGGAGGNTTFTGPGPLTLTAPGGGGGVGRGVGQTAPAYSDGGTAGSIPTNGDVNIQGQNGLMGILTIIDFPQGGNGADSLLGLGGVRTAVPPAGNGSVGPSATGYGSGGGGAANNNVGGSGPAGAAGAQGIIIIYEFA